MANYEQELKLLLDERQYNNIVKDATSSAEHTNHYFYCDDFPEGLVVRIRHGQDYVLTVKVHVSHTSDVTVCQEHDASLTESYAFSLIDNGISPEQLYAMVGIVVPAHLRYLGNMTTMRSIVDIEGHRVEVDKSSYLGVVDYELEYENSDLARMQSLRSVLLHRYALSLQPSQSKFSRFCDTLAKIPMMLDN